MDMAQMTEQWATQTTQERQKVCQWIVELCNAETRENAILELR